MEFLWQGNNNFSNLLSNIYPGTDDISRAKTMASRNFSAIHT